MRARATGMPASLLASESPLSPAARKDRNGKPRVARTSLRLFGIVFLLVLLVFATIGAHEYIRLSERGAGFDTAWNPMTHSWDAYFEGEKRSSKQTLYNLWHGAGIFPVRRKIKAEGSTPENEELESLGPTLEELLMMPSKYPFNAVDQSFSGVREQNANGEGRESEYLKAQLSDVTVVLNHFARMTLRDQLWALASSSVLPQEIWVCLFAVDSSKMRQKSEREEGTERSSDESFQGPRTYEQSYPREAFFRNIIVEASDPSGTRLGQRLAGRGVKVRFIASDFNFKFYGRFQMVLQAPTEFVWLIDDDVVPGSRFLEVLLHVSGITSWHSSSQDFKTSSEKKNNDIQSDFAFGALGATGWLMPPPPSGPISSDEIDNDGVHHQARGTTSVQSPPKPLYKSSSRTAAVSSDSSNSVSSQRLFQPHSKSTYMDDIEQFFRRADRVKGNLMKDVRQTVTSYRDPSTHGGLYLPDDRYNLTVTRLTEVDLLCSQWFLRTAHVGLLFRERPPTYDTGEDMMLSYVLRKYAGLGSFIIPVVGDTSPPSQKTASWQRGRETWGNTRPASHTTLNTDRPATAGAGSVALRNAVWARLMARGAVPLRLALLRRDPIHFLRRFSSRRWRGAANMPIAASTVAAGTRDGSSEVGGTVVDSTALHSMHRINKNGMGQTRRRFLETKESQFAVVHREGESKDITRSGVLFEAPSASSSRFPSSLASGTLSSVPEASHVNIDSSSTINLASAVPALQGNMKDEQHDEHAGATMALEMVASWRCSVLLVVATPAQATSLREVYRKLMEQGCRTLPLLSLDRPHHGFTDVSDVLHKLRTGEKFGGIDTSHAAATIINDDSTVDDIDVHIKEQNSFYMTETGSIGATAMNSGGSKTSSDRGKLRSEVSCALLMSLLGAPQQQCRDDHFGVFRIAKTRIMSASSSQAPSVDTFSSLSTLRWGSPFSTFFTSSAAASTSDKSMWVSPDTQLILDAPAFTAPHIAGHLDEIISTIMAVVRSVRPVAIIWLDENTEKARSPHFEESGIVAIAVRTVTNLLKAQPEVGFGGALRRSPRFRGSVRPAVSTTAVSSSSSSPQKKISPLPLHLPRAYQNPAVSPGHTVASVLASLKSPPAAGTIQVRYLI